MPSKRKNNKSRRRLSITYPSYKPMNHQQISGIESKEKAAKARASAKNKHWHVPLESQTRFRHTYKASAEEEIDPSYYHPLELVEGWEEA